MRLLLTTLVLGLSVGCTQFPELEQTVDPEVENQPYPELRPQGILIEEANDFDSDEDEARENLSQRAEDLGARADAIRAPDEPEP